MWYQGRNCKGEIWKLISWKFAEIRSYQCRYWGVVDIIEIIFLVAFAIRVISTPYTVWQNCISIECINFFYMRCLSSIRQSGNSAPIYKSSPVNGRTSSIQCKAYDITLFVRWEQGFDWVHMWYVICGWLMKSHWGRVRHNIWSAIPR